jgi:hypothetical protein
MTNWARKIYAFFTETKERTWMGHTAQGVGIELLFVVAAVLFGYMGVPRGPVIAGGVFFNAGFWVQREVVADFIQQIPVIGLAAAKEKFMDDNWMDMFFPMAAAAVVAMVAAIFLVP